MAQVATQLREANRVDDVWSAVEKAMGVLDARWASVELVLDVDGKRRGLKVAGEPQAPSGLTKSRHGLLAERPEKGFLELAWPVETTPGRDAEIAIETLCVQVREALEGVVERPSMVGELRPRMYTLPPPATGPRLYSLPPAAVGTRSFSLPPVSVGPRRPRPSLAPVPAPPKVPSISSIPALAPSGRRRAA